MIYSEWAGIWYRNYVQPYKKISTMQKYRDVLKKHVIPILGYVPVKALYGEIIQRFVCKLNESYSSGTVNTVIAVLLKSLNDARLNGVISAGEVPAFHRPQKVLRRVECFNSKEQRSIEKYILESKKKRLFGIIICFYTGLRIGELLALEWSDVDLENGRLNVNKSCHYGRDVNGVYKRIVEAPKTESSDRIVPIPQELTKYFKMMDTGDCLNVVSHNGKPVPTRTYQAAFTSILKKLGIENRCFHSIRHTFATRALESGMDVRTLSELMGHKNPSVTLSRYAHSLIEHKTLMMEKLVKYCQLI